jgi:uracil phosphoribosyltransferase
MIHDFSKTNSIFQTFVAELRDLSIQKDSMRFRRNLERISEVLAYELSKELDYEHVNIKTPLGIANTPLLKEQPILATILRAGLGMHLGLLNYFDRSNSAFISAYRKHTTLKDFEIYVEYLASPKIDKKVLIISDPMLATGSSMAMAYKAILRQGTPSRLIVVSAIAAPEALDFLSKELPKSTTYYIGAIDDKLTAQSFIVPGLGDAGDLAYGIKS